jgi:hypothetical protein
MCGCTPNLKPAASPSRATVSHELGLGELAGAYLVAGEHATATGPTGLEDVASSASPGRLPGDDYHGNNPRATIRFARLWARLGEEARRRANDPSVTDVGQRDADH